MRPNCRTDGYATSRSAAAQPPHRVATHLGDERDILIDPVTDMPAVRNGRGTIETVAPQRLLAQSPLATLTIGRAKF